MIIIDMVLGLLQGVLLLGGGLFVWRDYHNNFSKSRQLYDHAYGWLRARLGKVTEEEKAARIVRAYAAQVATFREAVANLRASYDQSEEEAGGQEILADKYADLAEKLLRTGDEDGARVAASAKINCIARGSLHRENMKRQKNTAEKLVARLSTAEMNLHTIQSQAETIRIGAEIARANRRLYELISAVSAESGFSSLGEFDSLVLESKREMGTTEHLVALASESSSVEADKLIQNSGVDEEIERVRSKIALASPKAPETNMRQVVLHREEVGNFEKKCIQ